MTTGRGDGAGGWNGESQGFLDVLKRMENCHQPTRFARDPLPFLRGLQLWQH